MVFEGSFPLWQARRVVRWQADYGRNDHHGQGPDRPTPRGALLVSDRIAEPFLEGTGRSRFFGGTDWGGGPRVLGGGGVGGEPAGGVGDLGGGGGGGAVFQGGGAGVWGGFGGRVSARRFSGVPGGGGFPVSPRMPDGVGGDRGRPAPGAHRGGREDGGRMKVGVPTEIKTDEYRVALTPAGRARARPTAAMRCSCRRAPARARRSPTRDYAAQGARDRARRRRRSSARPS